MIITIELPDATRCAFISYVFDGYGEMLMSTSCISSEELIDGNKITIPRKETHDHDNL